MAWLLLAASMALLAMVGALLPPASTLMLDWQPGRAATEWWRAFSAIGVHYSVLHLAANLLGVLAVAVLGWAAALPLRCSLAWLLAWPLTQLGLLVEPALQHFGGLSGVLHAGVVIASVFLVWRRAGAQRLIGLALLVGVALKLLAEQPWGDPLRQTPGWDIALAPLAHATGALAGACCGVLAELHATLRRSPR